VLRLLLLLPLLLLPLLLLSMRALLLLGWLPACARSLLVSQLFDALLSNACFSCLGAVH